MNSAPNQPPVSSVSSAPSSGSTPPPKIPTFPSLIQPLISNLPKETNYPQSVPSNQGLPASNTPIVPPPPVSIPPAVNYQPPPVINNPLPPISSSPTNVSYQPKTQHKFPFMMVTLILVIVLAGLAGSFLFFSYKSTSSRKAPAQILITPPVPTATAVIPTKTSANPFATNSSDLINPFASPSASLANPFGTYQNPFQSASPSGNSNQPYQNPFENLK